MTGAGTEDVKPEEEVPEDDDDSRRWRERVKITHEKEIVEEDNIYQPHALAVIVPIFDNEQKEQVASLAVWVPRQDQCSLCWH